MNEISASVLRSFAWEIKDHDSTLNTLFMLQHEICFTTFIKGATYVLQNHDFINVNVFQIKVVWKEQTRTQWQSQLNRKVSLCLRSLAVAAASTSIHSISIQAREPAPAVSFFIQHPGYHPSMWRSRMLENASKLFFAGLVNPIFHWAHYTVHGTTYTVHSIHQLCRFFWSQPSWFACRV